MIWLCQSCSADKRFAGPSRAIVDRAPVQTSPATARQMLSDFSISNPGFADKHNARNGRGVALPQKIYWNRGSIANPTNGQARAAAETRARAGEQVAGPKC